LSDFCDVWRLPKPIVSCCAPIDGAHQLCCVPCTLVRRVALRWRGVSPSLARRAALQLGEACRPSLSPSPTTLPSPLMSSQTHPTLASSSSFQLIFDNALRAYERRTKKDLRNHPLAAQLQECSSPSNILDVLQQQVEELNQSQRRNENWTRWLDPTVKVLHAFSGTLGEHVTSVGLRLSTRIRPALLYPFHRHFHQQRPSLLQLASSFW
jgi:hypothetical protein